MKQHHCPWELTTAVDAAAAAIAKNLTDEQLALLAAVLVSLSDNLVLILAQRECEQETTDSKNTNLAETPQQPSA